MERLEKDAPLWVEADGLTERVPIGTTVRYWTGARGHGPGALGRIRHRFMVMCGSVVGWVDTHAACIAATHIEEERGKPDGYEAAGMNPHYRPPLNRLRTVEVKFPVDCLAALILDSEDTGSLVIVAVAGEVWPDNIELAPGQKPRRITAERPFFRVTAEDRGPAVDHEFLPDPDDPSRCLTCGVEG